MEFRKPGHTGHRRERSKESMYTSDGTPFTDAETLNKFREAVVRAKIPGVNTKLLAGALVGEDMAMWKKLIKNEAINKINFQNYYDRVERDKMSDIFGPSRYMFATYIFNNAKFE